MKVKDLIKILQNLDQEKEIRIKNSLDEVNHISPEIRAVIDQIELKEYYCISPR